MALASRGNCSLSSVERTAENNSAFSSSAAECKEGDFSICCCCAIMGCKAGRAAEGQVNERKELSVDDHFQDP